MKLKDNTFALRTAMSKVNRHDLARKPYHIDLRTINLFLKAKTYTSGVYLLFLVHTIHMSNEILMRRTTPPTTPNITNKELSGSSAGLFSTASEFVQSVSAVAFPVTFMSLSGTSAETQMSRSIKKKNTNNLCFRPG